MGKINDETWLKFYDYLKIYHEKNGNSNVPALYVTEDGIKLGAWLKKQKELYFRNRLADYRLNMLEELKVIWSYHEELWKKHYASLLEYYQKNGDIDVPEEYIMQDGFELGRWLNEQRSAHKNGILKKRRTKLLNDLGIKWNPRKDKWDDKYYVLEEYYNKYGHINVPISFTTDNGFGLGYWLNTQRQAYKRHSSYRINKDQIMLLNDLGMDWSPRDTNTLNNEITDYKSYKKILLERMKYILEDLSYEYENAISTPKKQLLLENEIIERMWH